MIGLEREEREASHVHLTGKIILSFSEVVDCLSLVSQALGRIHKYSVELENELLDSVRQPLIDLSNAEVREDLLRKRGERVRESNMGLV